MTPLRRCAALVIIACATAFRCARAPPRAPPPRLRAASDEPLFLCEEHLEIALDELKRERAAASVAGRGDAAAANGSRRSTFRSASETSRVAAAGHADGGRGAAARIDV